MNESGVRLVHDVLIWPHERIFGGQLKFYNHNYEIRITFKSYKITFYIVT